MKRPIITEEGQKRAVIDGIVEGHTLTTICSWGNMPRPATVAKWRRQDPEFAADYKMAMEARAMLLVDELLGIADEAGKITTFNPDTGEMGVVYDSAKVSADRERLNIRRWLAAKYLPKDFGDRVAHAHEDAEGAPLRLIIGATSEAYKPEEPK